MKNKLFYEICKEGKTPLIKMGENVYEYSEESFDPKMMGKVLNVSIDHEDSYRILVDMNGFEAHNKAVAPYDWKDEKGELTKCWLDTKWYPEDGIEALYLPLDGEVPFEIVEDNSLFVSYLNSKSNVGYVEWLESLVKKLELQAEIEDLNKLTGKMGS